MEHPASDEVGLPRHEIDKRLAAVKAKNARQRAGAVASRTSGDCTMLLPPAPLAQESLTRSRSAEERRFAGTHRRDGNKSATKKDQEGDHGQDPLRALRRSRRRLPAVVRARRRPDDRALPRRADARRRREAIDFTPGELLGSVSGELGLREFLEGRGPHADRHLRQGRARLGVRARASRRGGRHLAAVLARLPDRGADRQGAEPEARDHGRHRLGPRRPAGGDRAAASPSPRSPTPTASASPSTS